jgi:hypothetical protein
MKCYCSLKNELFYVYLGVLIVTLPGTIASIFDAGNAFYEQVILKQPYGIKLRISPDAFRPVESFDRCRPYCSINKASSPKVPQTVTV